MLVNSKFYSISLFYGFGIHANKAPNTALICNNTNHVVSNRGFRSSTGYTFNVIPFSTKTQFHVKR